MGGPSGINRVQLKDIPNLISVVQALFVLTILNALLERDIRGALVWFALAGLSDGLDGIIARHFGRQSRLGSLLDPIADTLLLATSYGCLAFLGLLPNWLAALVIGRDLLIFSGSLIFHFRLNTFEGKPSQLSKFNTFCQIASVIGIISSQTPWPLFERWLPFLLYGVAASTLLSRLYYLKVFGKEALSVLHGIHPFYHHDPHA